MKLKRYLTIAHLVGAAMLAQSLHPAAAAEVLGGTCPETGLTCQARGSAPCPQLAQTFDGCYFGLTSNAHQGRVGHVTRTYYVVDNITNCPLSDCGFSLEIVEQPNSGGHCHTSGTRPIGSPAGTSNYLGPIEITHTLPEFAGPILVKAFPDANCQEAHPFNATSQFFWICVMEPGTTCNGGLVRMPADTIYTFGSGFGAASQHGDMRYVSPNFLAQIRPPLRQYKEQRNLMSLAEVTALDGSLVWGGLVDLDHNWGTGSQLLGHRAGEALDLELRTAGGVTTMDDLSMRVLRASLDAANIGYRLERQGQMAAMHLYLRVVGGTSPGEED